MKKEKFISALMDLTPGCTKEMAEMWVRFAEENVENEQFVDFAESNPNGSEAAIEDWLDSVYAGIGLTKQRFNKEIALQIASLAAIPCCLYPHEMYAAAQHFEDGGKPESIPDMMTEGSLDILDETQWPMFPKLGMLLNGTDDESIKDFIVSTIADYIVKDGTTNTSEGNWIIYYEELAERFGMDETFLADMKDSIESELYNHEEVADVVLEGDAFDVCYYLAYCPNYIEKYEGELDDLNADEESGMAME